MVKTMNREYYINQFLNYYAEVYKQNPELEIKKDTFYFGLMTYDMSQEEYNNRDIKNYFEKWEQHFENYSDINVYYSNSQKRFLQFENGYPKKNYTHVKLYLSFPKDKIYECVNILFEFLASNNINHKSKVADMVRSDSVVLRINTMEQANKVIEFVNNNPFLVQNSKSTNAFLIKKGCIGMAYDGNLSYNSTLSMLLQEYFKYCRLNNLLDLVSMQHFKKFIIFYKNKIFSQGIELNNFLSKQGYLDRFYSKGIMANNYEKIFDLIICSLDNNVTLSQYEEKYNEFCISMNDNRKNQYYEQITSSQESDLTIGKVVLDSYIEYANGKYGKENVIAYLQNYMSGNIKAITRDNDFRAKFSSYLSIDAINKITNNNLTLYVKNALEKYDMLGNNLVEAYDQFHNACIQTFCKYGINQLHEALQKAINGNYNYFTNSNGNSRDYMKEKFNSDILIRSIKCLTANLGNLEDDYSKLIQNCCLVISKEVSVNSFSAQK